MIIPNKELRICTILKTNGYQAFIVGGAVRDHFMGLPPKDYDIATNAPPNSINHIFSEKGLKVKSDIGESFKKCTVEGVDITTFRKDRYFGSEAKYVEITYAETIQEDLERRDFTMNSIAYDPFKRKFIDPYDGIKDIKRGIIRLTGHKHPSKRLTEDPCRILRACRFLALDPHFLFHKDTFEHIKNLSVLVSTISPERIRIEILKTMEYPHPSRFFGILQTLNILWRIFPSMDKCWKLDGGKYHAEDIFTHLMIVGDSNKAENPLLRLASYLHDVGKPYAQNIDDGETTFYNHENIGSDKLKVELKKLKFSNSEVIYVTNLVRYHMRSVRRDSTPKAIRKLLRAFENDNVDLMDYFQMKIADRCGNLAKPDFEPEEIDSMIDQVVTIREKGDTVCTGNDLALDGFQIMEILNLTPGPEIGKVIEELIELTIDNPNCNNPWYLTFNLSERRANV